MDTHCSDSLDLFSIHLYRSSLLVGFLEILQYPYRKFMCVGQH